MMKTITDYLKEFFFPRELHLVILRRNGKEPTNKNWQTRKIGERAILKCATEKHNIGWSPQEEYLIIDIDPRNGGNESFLNLCELAGTTPDAVMDQHPTIITGSGGFHIYTRRPVDFSPPKVSKTFPGVDLLHHNTQVLIPGCTHPETFGVYHPRDGSPWPVDPPLFPSNICDAITAQWGSLGDYHDIEAQREELRGVLKLEELEFILSNFDAREFGSHDDWVSFLLGLHHGLDGDPGALSSLLEWCQSDPQYADDPRVEARLQQIWGSGTTRHHKPRTIWWYINHLPEDNTYRAALSDRAQSRELEVILNHYQNITNVVDDDHSTLVRLSRLSPSYRQQALDTLSNHGLISDKKTIKTKIKDLQPNNENQETKKTRQISQTIYSKYFDGKLLFVNDRELYFYKNTHWKQITHAHLDQLIMNYSDHLQWRSITEIRQLVMRQATIQHSLNLNLNPSNLSPTFNLQNFTVHVDPQTAALSVKSHNPKDMFFHTFPFDYDPSACCPAFDAMLTQTFEHIPSLELQQFIEYFWELFGYIIQPNKDIPLVLVWTGAGHNGKTTYTKFITALSGDAVVGGEIRQFHKSEHARAALEHKTAFIDDDVAAGTILDDTFLKTCSESKKITINPKYQTPRLTTINVTPILLTNNPITVLDYSHGMFRRVHVLPFHSDVSKYSQDLPREALNNELSGIFNSALLGLQRLRKRGRFDIPPAVQRATHAFFHKSNPILAYMGRHFIHDPTSTSTSTFPVDSVYQGYRNWSRSSGEYATLSLERFIDITQRAGYIINNDEFQNMVQKQEIAI